jgi:2-succinyl-6-hydroxy-2,4-cyclohexadiene-1-carboxylate synthase
MSNLQSNYWPGGVIPIHYYTAGNPCHPPLIFFHGFMGSGYDWLEIIDHFSTNYHCIAPDLPGHGKTILNRALRWEDLGKIFNEFIGSISSGGIIGTGYSMGGRLMLYLAVTFPALFKGLIIESASPGLKTAHERQVRFQQDQAMAEKLEQSHIGNFLEDWYRQPLFFTLRKHPSFNELLRQRKKENPLQLAAALRVMSSGIQPSLWPDLKNIKVPLLLLAGAADIKYTKLLTSMQKQCSGAQLKIIGKAGHNTHLENPLVFWEYMSNFLNQTGEKY